MQNQHKYKQSKQLRALHMNREQEAKTSQIFSQAKVISCQVIFFNNKRKGSKDQWLCLTHKLITFKHSFYIDIADIPSLFEL